jgi:hypothetical protein
MHRIGAACAGADYHAAGFVSQMMAQRGAHKTKASEAISPGFASLEVSKSWLID